MSNHLSYVQQVNANKWIVSPSGDGTGITDADAIQYVMDQLAGRTQKGIIELTEGTFYVAKQLNGVSLRATIRGASAEDTCIIAGRADGGPMELVPLQFAIDRRTSQLPCLMDFSVSDSLLMSYDVTIERLHIRMLKNDDARPGLVYVGLNRPGLNVVSLINFDGQKHVGYRLANGVSLSKSGSVMTLEAEPGTFRASDVGKYVTIAGAAAIANNGRYLVTAVPDSSHAEYTNASGVIQADYHAVFAINEPAQIGVHGGVARVLDVCFSGQTHDSVHYAANHACVSLGRPDGQALPSLRTVEPTVNFSDKCVLPGGQIFWNASFDGLEAKTVDYEMRRCSAHKAGVISVIAGLVRYRSAPVSGLPFVFRASSIIAKSLVKDCSSLECLQSPYAGVVGMGHLFSETYSVEGNKMQQTMATPNDGVFVSAPLQSLDTFSGLYKGIENLGSLDSWFSNMSKSFKHNTVQYDNQITSGSMLRMFGTTDFEVRQNDFIASSEDQIGIFGLFPANGVIHQNRFSGIPSFIQIILVGANEVELKHNTGPLGANKSIQLHADCSDCTVVGDTVAAIVNLGTGSTISAVGSTSTNPADLTALPPAMLDAP